MARPSHVIILQALQNHKSGHLASDHDTIAKRETLPIKDYLTTQLNNTETGSDTDSEVTGSTQMNLKPLESLFDLNHKRHQLLKNLEFTISRLQKIIHLLSSGIEISPERFNDLVRHAKRCERSLQKLNREYNRYARSASQTDLQPVKEQLIQASRLSTEAMKLVTQDETHQLYHFAQPGM